MYLEKLEKAMDYRDNYEQKVSEAANYIKYKLGIKKPIWGIVLGSGLGDLANNITDSISIPYSDIPNFPVTTTPGHEGKLIIGELEGVPLIGLKGRKHYYEVSDEPFNTGILQAVFPVHVLAELGVKNYFATNAVGGLNPNYKVGDLMIIKSHISLIPSPPLGRHHNFKRIDNDEQIWRFQPMNNAYDPDLRELLHKAGNDKEHIHEGTYLAVTGPTYETEGEAIAFRNAFKADCVGMSIAPEVIIARNRGMKALAMSCITNTITKEGVNAANHDEVKAILESNKVKDRLFNTVKNFFKLYKDY